jgi:hypothetical protein
MAIVRELSSNAYDSHVCTKNVDTPFEVHLPNRFNPHFYVRDFGSGLSTEDVFEVYTTFFESTKEDNNDEVGCLGLGSKSPFCLVDVFTVISFFNGKKTTFSAFLDEEEAPSCAKISCVDTDEPNGLLVQLPVKENLYGEFLYKAQRVYRYFNVKPNMVGEEAEITSPQYSTSGNQWGICSDRERGRPLAIMGQVAYPVNIDLHDLTSLEKAFLRNLSVDMYFDIGLLDFVPSREQLAYDEKTTTIIRERINSIIEFERKRFLTSLKNTETFWEACLFVNKEIDEKYLIKQMFLDEELEWKGRKVSPTNNYITFASDDFRTKVGENEFKSHVKIYSIKKKEIGNWETKITITRPEVVQRISVSSRIEVFVDDIGHGSYSRARSYLNNAKELNRLYYVVLDKPKLNKKFCKRLGVKKVKNLSSVPKPVIKRKPRGEGCKDAIFYFRDTYSQKASVYWNKPGADFDLDEGGFYMPINRWKIEDRRNTEDEKYDDQRADYVIPALLEVMKELGHTDVTRVYGIKKVKVKALEKRSNWVNLRDFVEMEVSKLAKDEDFLHNIRMAKFRASANNSSPVKLVCAMILHDTDDIRQNKFYKRCRSSNIRGIARAYCDTFNEDLEIKTYRRARQLMRSLGITLPDLDSYSTEFNDRINRALKKYPLLVQTTQYSKPKNVSQVLDYINGMELLKP